MIKIQYTLTFIIITSLILPLQYQTLIFANGQIQRESNIIIYDKDKVEHNTILSDSDDNMLLKPKVDVKIEGTFQNDTMRGGEGNDEIDGGKGDDILDGKDGNDKIKGGGGSDRINGGIGNDQLEGEKGNDRIFGGEGKDLLDGGEGNDILLSGREADMMIGGFGSDTFICDQYDILVDFDHNEGDKIIGSCSIDDLVEEKEEEKEANKIEEIHEENNIFPIESETSKSERMLQPLQSSSKLLPQAESLNSFDKSSLLSKDFQRISPPPIPSLNSFDIPLPLPNADLQSSSPSSLP